MSNTVTSPVTILQAPAFGGTDIDSGSVSGGILVPEGDVSSPVSIDAYQPPSPMRLVFYNSLSNGGVELPLLSSGTYDFIIDWGDGTDPDSITAYNQPEIHHDYSDDSEYHATIRGVCTGFSSATGTAGSFFTNTLKEVLAWGDVSFDELSFEGCIYLQSTADGCRINPGGSLNAGFSTCSAITSIGSFIGGPSGLTGQLFYNSALLQSVGSIDLSGCTVLSQMVDGCSSLESFLGYGISVDVDFSGNALQALALNTIFSNLATVSGKTITITGNPGAGTCNQSIATGKGWTVVN